MKKFILTLTVALTVMTASAEKPDPTTSSQSCTDINAVFIGNSITQGAIMKEPEKNSPPAQCAQLLGQAQGIGTVAMFNAGVSGRTTVDFLPGDNPMFNRIAEGAASLKNAHPEAVTVFSMMLGTNDSASKGPTGSPVSDADYKKNISLIIDSLQARFPDAIFILHRPVWYSANTHNGAVYLAEGQRRLDGYYTCLKELVGNYSQTNPGHVFMGDTDAYEHFRSAHEEEMFAEKGYSGTFYLHPNIEGAKALARFWADAILRALRPSAEK